ncbi:MAG: DUF5060 domain-containing protein [Candidatus Hydrogenedentes bacterium]|nr:DUF5060 domain-containing protein [Candidatus Hydrogenedentota bacterium]
MSFSLIVVLALTWGIGQADTSSPPPIAITAVTPNATSVPCFARFELNLDLAATFDNPFDPAEVDVYAIFTSPDGKTLRVNGYYTQACKGNISPESETITPVGEPFWQIRFAPNKEGTWKYRVIAKDRTGEASLPDAEFAATPSTSPGYIRRNAQSPHLFAYDNGQPYLPIGENMCWGKLSDYDNWLPALGKAEGNWIRIWCFRWNCGFEWSPLDRQSWDYGTFQGLGRYNLASAWRLDRILDTAEQNGVNAMLCLGTYGEFTTGGFFNEGMWNTNPYNAANGGPCEKPEDFWTNERARALYKQRLRYLTARYGWRTNVFAWEFWNEANAPEPWVREMAQYVKGTGAAEPVDSFGHLVSTTYGTPEVWNIPEIDFTQSHLYGEANLLDVSPVILNDARQHRAFGKPHIPAEFGIDWRSSDDKQDTAFKGVNLHNALWASVLSGNGGSAMIWYWDSYVHPGQLYPQFTALRRFTENVPWHNGPWRPVEMDKPEIQLENETWRDMSISPTVGWGKSKVPEFVFEPNKDTGGDPLPSFLYGTYKPELRVPLVLKLKHDRPWRFDVHVNSVCTMARLQISVDGNVVLDHTLSAAPPEKDGEAPEYESTELRTDFPCYQAKFNKKYGVDVPAGEHTITVDITDGDWLNVTSYIFGSFLSDRHPKMNYCGLTNGQIALLWFQNADSNWQTAKAGTTVTPIKDARTILRGLPDGEYTCEWFDTWKGEASVTNRAMSSGGVLPLTLPDLTSDAALTIRP